MSKITLEEISEELEKEGWEVVSTEYKNLKTEMQFKCAEGHLVVSTWEHIRQKRYCPVCANNKFKNPVAVVVPRKTNTIRILALDQATHVTGWSVFDGHELIQYGTFQVSVEDEKDRLHEVNMWLMSMINNWQPDVVGLEGIQYQANVGVTTFQVLARLQGILMETCTQLGLDYSICPTNTWRAHCKVKGKTRVDKKRSMQLLVKQWFDISIDDDSADAIGIGKYLAETYRKPIKMESWE